MSNDSRKIRRDRRAVSRGLDARYRAGASDWCGARLLDLSMGGALISCAADDAVAVGRRLTLLLESRSDGHKIEVLAEVLRASDREGQPRRAALRFVEIGKDAATSLANTLNEELALDEDDGPEEGAEGEATINGRSLTTLRLHETSLYDLLQIDPACPSGELEGHGEALILTVAAALAGAVGRRESRLQVLHNSLLRMRPLWNDPVKRARYDLRWGYARVEERLAEADSGAGIHANILAGIWFDLYPDLVREAEKVMMRVRSDGIVVCLKKAIELDPFNRRRRQRLAALESPPEPDVEAPAMPAPGAPQTMRGSLGDVPLRVLVRAAAEDQEDAEIVVRVNGQAVGVVGITRGDLVTAIAGEARGVDALRLLSAIEHGTFQARYASPRAHLRHMRAPALEMLERALHEFISDDEGPDEVDDGDVFDNG